MANHELATFAGGCFWCMVMPFDEYPGVNKVVSGYTGGWVTKPSYEQVCSGNTGHLEAIQITFNPNIISYQKLLDIFWRQIDPTDPGGQFCDKGDSYRTAIFYHSPAQKDKAEASKDALAASGRFQKPIVTAILPAQEFWPAEEYHQSFYKKNPKHYNKYRQSSGRDEFIEKHWSFDVDDEALRQSLTDLQYHVTREDGTEPPFDNEYWNEKREGIYVDIISGEPLFISSDKYDSGSGWPSFTKPFQKDLLVEKLDTSRGRIRTEVRSKLSDSHLGHVFKDGPRERGGLRYCINSAALKFIPKEKLAEEGYGQYLQLFSEDKD